MLEFIIFAFITIAIFAGLLLLPAGLSIALSVLFLSILFLSIASFSKSNRLLSCGVQGICALVVIVGNMITSVGCMVALWWLACGRHIEPYASFLDYYYERAVSPGIYQFHLIVVIVAAIWGLIAGSCVYAGRRLWLIDRDWRGLLKVKRRNQNLPKTMSRVAGLGPVFFGFIFMLGMLSIMSFGIVLAFYDVGLC